MANAELSIISETLKYKNYTAVYLLHFELAKEEELIMQITSLLQKTYYHGFMYCLTFVKFCILEEKIL